MCGLAGIARHPKHGDLALTRELLPLLLLSIADRGKHATGVAVSAVGRDDYILKVAVPAPTFVKGKPFELNVMDRITDGTAIIQGHTRHATLRNAHEDEAAHPFVVGNVVGAHNGIITNWRTIEKKLKADWIVDSQAALGLLDYYQKPGDALKQLEGYFALTWTKRGELSMVRSPDAVLSCAYSPRYNLLIWNSTIFALHDVLKKLKIENDFHVWNLNPATVYRFDPQEFNHQSANGVKIPVKLDGNAKTGKDAFSKWGKITSGEKTTLPTKYVPKATAAFNSIEDRVEHLELLVQALSKKLRSLIPEVESNSQEVSYMMTLMAEAGLMGDVQEDDDPECIFCGLPEMIDEKLIEDAGGNLIHESCLFQKAGS